MASLSLQEKRKHSVPQWVLFLSKPLAKAPPKQATPNPRPSCKKSTPGTNCLIDIGTEGEHPGGRTAEGNTTIPRRMDRAGPAKTSTSRNSKPSWTASLASRPEMRMRKTPTPIRMTTTRSDQPGARAVAQGSPPRRRIEQLRYVVDHVIGLNSGAPAAHG